MKLKSFWMTEPLGTYIADNWVREPALLAELRDSNEKHPNGGYAISPEQGQFMSLFASLIGARRYLEVGTFTGYSTISVVTGMGADGVATCCDISEEFTTIARRYWERAGISDQVELRLGPASETLATLISEGAEYDLCFIDADKPGYADYFEKALRLVKAGGVIMIDNVLWSGRIADGTVEDESTVALRGLNAALHDDERIDLSLVPIGDGLTVCRIRG